MGLPIKLQNIKSSGIYRYVWDKSILKNIDKPTLRLLVGYSEKGPFNTPVLINNTVEFMNIFGKIDHHLENKGQFFHRSALYALSKGPILALNLKPFEDESIEYLSLDTGDLNDNIGFIKKLMLLKEVYNTNRFWELDAEDILNKIDIQMHHLSKYINIVNTGTESYTVLIRPYKPLEYKNITIQSWYSGMKQELPNYLEYVKYTDLDNYFILIYIFKTEFTKESCDTGGVFDKYFNVNGNNISIKTNYKDKFGAYGDALYDLANDPTSQCIGLYQGCTIPDFIDMNGRNISINNIFNSDTTMHKMLMLYDESKLEDRSAKNILNRLSGVFGEEIKVKSNLYSNTYVYTDKKHVMTEKRRVRFKMQENDPDNLQVYSNYNEDETILEGDNIEVYSYMSDSDNHGRKHASMPVKLTGYIYNTINNNMAPQQVLEKVLSVLGPTYSIREALTNKADIEYHYLVDTMDSYILTECKSQLSMIAKTKGNSIALINFPKIRDFAQRSEFINPNTNSFDFSMLLNRKDIFSLPSEVEGAEYAAYFTQMIFTDGGRLKPIPSAALVSNCFVDKYLNKFPFIAVAGKNGVIEGAGVVGPEFNFDLKDRDILEILGVNAITFKNNTNTIVANKTAKLLPLTALSYINICELMIYILDEVENILQDYQWGLNTGITRSAIALHCIALCDKAKQNGGILAFRVICDESNNTPESIDNEMLIVDIEIIPSHCTSKMVLRLTLNKSK